MDTILKPFRKFTRYDINDKVIFLKTGKEYVKQFRLVFLLFLEKNIKLLPIKSWIGYKNVELLGFYVNGFWLLNIKEKITALTNINPPAMLK